MYTTKDSADFFEWKKKEDNDGRAEYQRSETCTKFHMDAAENYELEPLYLAFSPDGRADMYLNMTIGLTYKWFDQEKIDAFFNMLAGKEQELYEGLLWIGLENAL